MTGIMMLEGLNFGEDGIGVPGGTRRVVRDDSSLWLSGYDDFGARRRGRGRRALRVPLAPLPPKSMSASRRRKILVNMRQHLNKRISRNEKMLKRARLPIRVRAIRNRLAQLRAHKQKVLAELASMGVGTQAGATSEVSGWAGFGIPVPLAPIPPGSMKPAKRRKILIQIRQNLNKRINQNEKMLGKARTKLRKKAIRDRLRQLRGHKTLVLAEIARIDGGKIPGQQGGAKGVRMGTSSVTKTMRTRRIVQGSPVSGYGNVINVGGLGFGQEMDDEIKGAPVQAVPARFGRKIARRKRQRAAMVERAKRRRLNRKAAVARGMHVERSRDIMRGHMAVSKADVTTRMALRKYDGYPDDSDELMSIVGGTLGFADYSLGAMRSVRMVPRQARRRERAWPAIQGQPIKPTENRIAKFAIQVERDVVERKRHHPMAIATRRSHLMKLARQHSVTAAMHAQKANQTKRIVDALKREIGATPPSNSAQKVQLVKQILQTEAVGRAHAAQFAVHGAAAQKATISESMLAEAAKQAHPVVRAKIVAQAEVVEKVPDKVEIAATAKEATEKPSIIPEGKQNLPIPTVEKLVKQSSAARAIISRGGIPGLTDAVREKIAMRRVGSFIHGYGSEAIDYEPSASQLDPWGRPMPGPTIRDEAMVDWIESSFGELGNFSGGFSGFEGWWTRYKKRAARRNKNRLKKIGKSIKKSVKKTAKDIGKAALSSAKKAGIDAAEKLATKAVDVAAAAAERGINKGIEKLGSSAGQAAEVEMTETVTTSQDLAPTDNPVDTGGSAMSVIGRMTGMDLPKWADYAALAVGLTGGALVARKLIKRRG